MFYITLAYNELTKKSLGNVYLFKWDMTTSMRWEQMDEIDRKDYTKTRKLWEEIVDLKDSIFFVNLARDYSVFYRRTIASELGGYVHIHDKMYNLIYSYYVQDKTISIFSSKLSPLSHLSLWECAGLEGDLREAMCTLQSEREKDNDDKKIVIRSAIDNKDVELNESRLLNTPFHILEMIMQLCVGVEYMHFRATCKHCNLAAPLILWSNKTSTLRKYSLVSPWLMVMDKNQGIFSFTDPMFGDKYFMKNSQVSVVRPDRACCSRFGWLLFYSSDFSNFSQQRGDVYNNLDFTSNILVFFNPFTNDVCMLPPAVAFLPILSFSAPPTSPDCIVIGFKRGGASLAYIHLVGHQRHWRVLHLGPNAYPSCFPTFYGQDVRAITFYGEDVYALCNEGQLYVSQNIVKQDCSWKQVAAARTSCRGSSSQCFLVRGDQHLLLVTVSKFGENVEVFKLNDYTKEWEKVDCLGRHMIYISGTTCLCTEAEIAETPEMENNIYFHDCIPETGR
ncbi:hypothetical protein CTI12_AA062930 [Artemisia annua]|uniref:KIB1-4 beta-propeller domain-containing protein n=1 Tax=Artemisia annua TaxID=35608 RepID=A0A2U1Q829_ARTAN|nr:hypothetical protein CTI12_AA062930 [Artemisia annua]